MSPAGYTPIVGAAILPADAGSRQRLEDQLQESRRRRGDGRVAAAADARDPEDPAVRFHDGQARALPARDLRVDEEGFQTTLPASERREAVAGAPAAHGEPCRQPGGVERDALPSARHLVRRATHDPRLEDVP